MDVTLRYFDGCPNWQTADVRLREALAVTGHAELAIRYEKVETPDEAAALRFTGSPTVLLDGRDAFETPSTDFGLACRLYPTPAGLAGAPTLEQLVEALS